MNYNLGLDIGIGSVGFAVIDNDNARVEKIGARIFDSGEVNDNSKMKRSSQIRREARGGYRQTRRRHHRKERLKFLFNKYGITTTDKLNAWYNDSNAVYNKVVALGLTEKFTTRDIYVLRAMALDYELTNEELCAVILHICNHRGYKPFYDDDDDDSDKKLMQGLSLVDKLMLENDYRTVGEMYALDKAFKNDNPTYANYAFVKNANKKGKKEKAEYYLVTRQQTADEINKILTKQAQYHNFLDQTIDVKTEGQIVSCTIAERITEILFSQRDFEDGPSQDPNNKSQKYHGFGEDNSGFCRFYKAEKRGIRASLLGDVYATTNLLSQYTYIDLSTGEIGISPDAAKEIVDRLISDGEMSANVLKEILKKYNQKVNTKIEGGATKENTFAKCNKFLKVTKQVLVENGVDWCEFISGDPLSDESPIQKLAATLAYNVTPKRRVQALKKVDFITSDLANKFTHKYGGTTMVSNKFMRDSINAFMSGEIYGDFQARRINELEQNNALQGEAGKLQKIDDIDIIKNPVVYRSINESRKVVNAIIDKYGMPTNIMVEVASELSQSFETRAKVASDIKKHEKANDALKAEIAEKIGKPVNDITPKMLDAYKLYLEQECKCFYSGVALELGKVLNGEYEIDHIIPFSLILDDTLNNKCLVLRTQNQKKKQRTPLQYFREEHLAKQEADFMARVNAIYNTKAKKKKREYLLTPDIYQEELFGQWKSRNINDTRYITKYVCGMLKELQLANKGKVIPIKGGITAKFRNWWLVRAESNLECYQYISKVLKENRKAFSELKKSVLAKANTDDINQKLVAQAEDAIKACCDDMLNNYGFSTEYTTYLLMNNISNKNRDNNLHHGVDAAILALLNNKFIELASDNNKLYQIWNEHKRNQKDKYTDFLYNYNTRKNEIPSFDDYLNVCVSKMVKYYHMDANIVRGYLLNPNRMPCPIDNIKDQILVRTYDRDEDTFRYLCKEVYGVDEDYAKAQQMSLISAKPEKRIRGGMTDATLTKKGDAKPEQYAKVNGVHPNGKQNISYLMDNKYPLIEVYKTVDGKTATRGIRYTELTNVKGKLYLKKDFPENYGSHVMYLQKNDYVVILDKKGKVKIEGYYKSVKNINRSLFYFNIINSSTGTIQSIATGDVIKKYNIDILGNKGSEQKCGARSLSILPKELQ